LIGMAHLIEMGCDARLFELAGWIVPHLTKIARDPLYANTHRQISYSQTKRQSWTIAWWSECAPCQWKNSRFTTPVTLFSVDDSSSSDESDGESGTLFEVPRCQVEEEGKTGDSTALDLDQEPSPPTSPRPLAKTSPRKVATFKATGPAWLLMEGVEDFLFRGAHLVQWLRDHEEDNDNAHDDDHKKTAHAQDLTSSDGGPPAPLPIRRALTEGLPKFEVLCDNPQIVNLEEAARRDQLHIWPLERTLLTTTPRSMSPRDTRLGAGAGVGGAQERRSRSLTDRLVRFIIVKKPEADDEQNRVTLVFARSPEECLNERSFGPAFARMLMLNWLASSHSEISQAVVISHKHCAMRRQSKASTSTFGLRQVALEQLAFTHAVLFFLHFDEDILFLLLRILVRVDLREWCVFVATLDGKDEDLQPTLSPLERTTLAAYWLCHPSVLFWLQMACLAEEHIERFEIVLDMGRNLSKRLYPDARSTVDWPMWFATATSSSSDSLGRHKEDEDDVPVVVMAHYAAMLYLVISLKKPMATLRLIKARRLWHVFARGHFQGRFDLANARLPHNETFMMLAIRHDFVTIFDGK
jgi:hypothetical protein